MSTTNADRPLRNRPEMPSYFKKDRVGRDAFLSQIGHFNEEQRGLFNRLCDFWEPDMLYSKFITKVSGEFLNASASFDTLITYLEKAHCGLISRVMKDGQMVKDRIILTDRDDLRHWYWRVDEAWKRCGSGDGSSFPTVEDFSSLEGFPAENLEPLSPAELSSSFSLSEGNLVKIFILGGLPGSALIVTPATMEDLLGQSRNKLKDQLSDNLMQSVLSRLLGIMSSEMLRFLGQKDEEFWQRFSTAVLDHKEDLLAKRPGLTPEVFVAAKVVQAYSRNELEAAEDKKADDALKRETLQGILGQIAKKEGYLMRPSEYDEQFAPYQDKWPDLKEMFAAQCLVSTGRSALPIVANIGGDYIHRNHIFPLFKTKLREAGVEMRAFYLDMIERMLRTNNRDRITIFTSRSAFNADIRDRISEEFPVLGELFRQPRLVSEAIIHYATKVLKISDMERVKTQLETFFEPGTIRFKERDKLLHLPIRAMFQEAYSRLSWFRRFLLRAMGRYESYMNSIKSGDAEPAKQKASSKSQYQRASLGASSADSSRSGGYRPSGENAPRGKHKRKSAQPLKVRQYSEEQRDEAWMEFKNVYKKGKDEE
ncbi:MAG: hypothetical protein MI717_10305 [Spirochaetales bacterium]|nr:hypothetical protein [Spirochaetales bacterium]